MNQEANEARTLPGDPSLPSDAQTIGELVSLSESQSHRYTVEDFFRHPEKSNYQLSPDGRHLSWLGPYQRRLNLFVQSVQGGDARRLTTVGDRDIAWYFWKGNDRLIYAKDEGGDENFHLYGVLLDGGETRQLTPFNGVRIQLVDDLEDEPDEIVISMNRNNPAFFEPYRLDVRNGELRQLAENNDPENPIDSWMTDHEGELSLASRVTGGTNTELLYRPPGATAFQSVLQTDFRETVAPLFFDFQDPAVVYAASNRGRDKQAIVRLDLRTGEEIGPPVFAHASVDVSTLRYSRRRRVPTVVSYQTDKREHHFLDDIYRRIYETLTTALPGYEVALVDSDKQETRFLVRTYSDRSLGAYYFHDTNTGELTLLAKVSPWLDEQDMAPMRPISYVSRDGLTIPGYLTLPVGKPERGLPVVVLPHGGPWVRDHWGYQPEVQLLASRGYAVLQVNYRGSTGYGRSFWEAGFRQWGRRMQDDITDGVFQLIEKGIAHPDAIAIYGGSYGGYATLAGVTFTPRLYACAVDYVGVSNLFTFMQTIPPYWKPFLEMMYEMVGNPALHKDEMYAASPIFHTEKIRTPLFVVQGANDPRVNIEESDQIVRALRRQGVPVPYLVKYDEGHGFRNEENKFLFYKAMLGFLARHMPVSVRLPS
jgi:dipeptidyl aminopeptidase/acylaminoacyl peptidase